jgi:hypothetical protein
MAILEIPILNSSNYNFRIDLEGSTYNLGLKYNKREDRWYLDIKDEQDNPIVMGIKLVLNTSLTERFKDDRLFPGTLFLLSEADIDTDPGLEDLGTDIKLLYEESTS